MEPSQAGKTVEQMVASLQVAGDEATWTRWRAILDYLPQLVSLVDVATFAAVVERTGLDPLGDEILPHWMRGRDGEPKLLLVVSRGGFRSLARRQWDFDGLDGPQYEFETEDLLAHLLRDEQVPPKTVSLVLRQRNRPRRPLRMRWSQHMSDWAWRYPNSDWAKRPAAALARCLEFAALQTTWPRAFGDLTVIDRVPYARSDWMQLVAVPEAPAEGQGQGDQDVP